VDCFEHRDKLGLDVAIEALRFARGRKRKSATGTSSISHVCCDRIGSWHHTWKASRDADAAAEERRGLSTRATAQGRPGSGLKLRSRSVHGSTDSAKQRRDRREPTDDMMTWNRIPVLTPHGHLVLAPAEEARTLPGNLRDRLETAFERGVGHGLLELGIREVGTALPSDLAYWRDFAGRYVTTLCTSAETAGDASPAALSTMATPPSEMLAELASAAPPMPGGEYLNADVLAALWEQIDAGCRTERVDAKQTLQEFLKERNPAWHLVGRVHFNLAENRSDEEAPFAFIATYTTRLSARARAQHLRLAEALREYTGARNKARLLSLLKPVQEGARECAWLKAMVESGEIYHPLRWSAHEAFQFLTDVPKLEAAGIVVRAPSAWGSGRPPRPKVRATIGGRVPSVLGKDALLDFQMELTLGEERLTAAEVRTLLKGSAGLQFLRGRWVEVDRDKLKQLLDRFRRIETAAAGGGVTSADAMRLMTGVAVDDEQLGDSSDPDWSTV